MYFTGKTNHSLYQLRSDLIGTISAQKHSSLKQKLQEFQKQPAKDN